MSGNYFLYSSMKTCGYSFEVPYSGASNEYQQHGFLCRIRKKYVYTVFFFVFFLKKTSYLKGSKSVFLSCFSCAANEVKKSILFFFFFFFFVRACVFFPHLPF